MSLLRKASIVTTPTAYENGKILSVKPSIVLGEELVVNGDFATDSDWTKETGWSISNGNASRTNTGTYTALQQNILTTGKKYKITIQIKSISSGSIFGVRLGTNYILQGTLSSEGVYTGIGLASNATLSIMGDPTFTGSIDNISVKEAIDADFDFTRNSSATRVNSQGLIEDMQILSGDLVSNGDFSQEGSELVTNGDFSNGSTDWSVVGLATISNSLASFVDNGTNGNAYVSQNVFTVGKFYKVTFDITRYVAGRIQLQVNSIYSVDISGGVGTYTTYVESDNIRLLIKRDGAYPNYDFDIDNVSVKEVGQDWTVENNDANNYVEFNQEEGTVRLKFLNTSPITTLKSSTQYLSGKKYKLTVDVKEVVSGGIKMDAAGVSQTYNSVGVQEAIIEPTGNSYISFYRATANVDITLNSVSLIEITDDTNLPRIDYTGGEGHWLFEPQSTNLLLDSGFNDVRSTPAVGYWYKSPNASISENSVIGVDGLQSAATYTYNGGTGSEYFYGYEIAVTSGVTYTVSGYVKLGTAANFVIVLNDTTSWNTIPNGNFVATAVDGYDSWKRFEITFVAPTTNKVNIHLGYHQENGVAAQTNGSVFIDSFQLEQQSYATSYIPTEGSIKTRLADAAFGAGSSDLINSTEGVLYFEGSVLDISTPNSWISVSEDANFNSNQFNLRFVAGINLIQVVSRAGGLGQDVVLQYTLSDKTTINKIAIKYKLNDWALWVNGIEVDTETSSVAFTSNSLDILDFDRGNNSSQFYGNVKCVAVFKEALTDAELTCLTTI